METQSPTAQKVVDNDFEPWERMEICKDCPKYLKIIKVCRECACFLPLKTKIENQVCPLNKW